VPAPTKRCGLTLLSAVRLNKVRPHLFAFALLLAVTALQLVSLGGDLGLAFSSGTVPHRILFELRLPRLVVALASGGLLAILGASYQILLANPLAEPYVLGVSSAVALAAATAEVILGLGGLATMGTGVAGGMAAAALLVVFAGRTGPGATERIALFGMGLNFVLSSVLFLLLSWWQEQIGAGTLRWLFGQVPWVGPREAWLAAVSAGLALAVLVVSGRALDAVALGDDVARSLGFSAGRIRWGLVLVTSLALALVTTMTGSIGFVGLVIPHFVRLVVKPRGSRALVLTSFLWGALFLAFADGVSRRIAPPMEFPIGLITTLVGGPAFLWILARRPRGLG